MFEFLEIPWNFDVLVSLSMKMQRWRAEFSYSSVGRVVHVSSCEEGSKLGVRRKRSFSYENFLKAKLVLGLLRSGQAKGGNGKIVSDTEGTRCERNYRQVMPRTWLSLGH